MPANPVVCRLAGRIGAYTLHATHDSRDVTAAARAAFSDRFVDEVDPDHRLSEAERQRRATAAMRAHMARLALRSAQARRARSKRNAAPMDEMDAATEDGDGPANLQH